MANERLTSIIIQMVGVHHPWLLQSFSLAAAWSWGRRQFLQNAQEATLIAAKSDRERVFVRRAWFKKTAHQHRHNLIQQTSSESIKVHVKENQQQKLRQCKRHHPDTLQGTRALQLKMIVCFSKKDILFSRMGTSFLFVYCDGLNWQCTHHCTQVRGVGFGTHGSLD